MATRHVSLAETEATDGALDTLVGYNLKRAYVILRNDFRSTLGEDGFGPRAFSALSLIVEFPNLSQSELARRLGIERSGLVAIVDELEARGFLQRNPVPGDRRVQALSATRAGRAAFARAQAAVLDHEDRLLSDLSPQERETLIELLRRIRRREG